MTLVNDRSASENAFRKAVHYLARREHSRVELRRKLQAQCFSDEDIDSALGQLQRNNLQSDERFAEGYVRYRRQAGFGPLRIAAELRARGVAEPIISASVDSYVTYWHKQMIAACEKKFSHQNTDKPKQFRFLLSRGYSTEMINKYLSR